MELDKKIIKELTKDILESQYNLMEWYTYPFTTDVVVTEELLVNGEISDRDLDVCRFDFISSVIGDVVKEICERVHLPNDISNPDLEYIHDTVRGEILALIS